MNREKKQFVVIGVLVALVLGVGAFQFTRQNEAPAPLPKNEKAVAKTDVGTAKISPLKYPELMPLHPKDPFETAPFIAGSKAPEPVSKAPVSVPGSALNKPSRTAVEGTLPRDFRFDGPLVAGGKPEPLAPPKQVFGYTLIGITEGAHPTAVFDDGKGNQQLVEAGQGIGPSATVLSISRGRVRVKFNEETLTFNVGGNP